MPKFEKQAAIGKFIGRRIEADWAQTNKQTNRGKTNKQETSRDKQAAIGTYLGQEGMRAD